MARISISEGARILPNSTKLRSLGVEGPPTHPDEKGFHRIGDCSLCPRTEVQIARRNPDGSLVCTLCAYPQEECSKCHRVRTVATRVNDAGERERSGPHALCYECSAEPEPCVICEEIRPIVARVEGTRGEGPGVCKDCYPQIQPKSLCIICEELKPLVARLEGTRGEGPGVCKDCYPQVQKKEECVICKKLKPIVARLEGIKGEGPGVCKACYPKIQVKEKCSKCRKMRPIYKRLDGTRGKGPGLCRACYQKANKRICRWCGKLKPVVKSVRDKGVPRKNGMACCAVCSTKKLYMEAPKFDDSGNRI